MLLTTIFLSLTSCLATAPVINHCGYSWEFQLWRCKDTGNNANYSLPLNDPTMEGAQALPINDQYHSFKRGSDYLDYLEKQAEKCN